MRATLLELTSFSKTALVVEQDSRLRRPGLRPRMQQKVEHLPTFDPHSHRQTAAGPSKKPLMLYTNARSVYLFVF